MCVRARTPCTAKKINARITQGEDTFRAQQIALNLDTQEITLDGRVKGSVVDDKSAEQDKDTKKDSAAGIDTASDDDTSDKNDGSDENEVPTDGTASPGKSPDGGQGKRRTDG